MIHRRTGREIGPRMAPVLIVLVVMGLLATLSPALAAPSPDPPPGSPSQPRGVWKKNTPTPSATTSPTQAPQPTSTATVPSASSDLVAAYPFSEGAGTTVVDASSYSNNGTISGAAWTPQGRFGSALAFDGSTSRVTVASASSLNLGADFTLEAWVYPTALGGWRNVLLKQQGSGLAYGLYANTDTDQPAGYIYAGAEMDARGGSQIPLNSWTHLATTHDGAELKLFVNGNLTATRSAPGSAPDSSQPLEIGGNSLWGEHFSGTIDEVRVYNRALSQSEIVLDMNTSLVAGTQPPAPVPTSGPPPPPATPAPIASPAPVPPAGDTPSGGGEDWPQLGHDPQKTNASPQSVDGPYRYYWRWTDVPFASRVQPVIASGRLFVGGLNGTFYALDAAYDAAGGAPRILWQANLGSPVRSGAGVDGSTVVAGTHHGAIYGMDASTGAIRWGVSTGGAILAAPLISAGTAYLGSADGHFYAIRTSDGAVLWKQSIGVPILGSAALSSDGTRLFFVAENVKAYALSTSSGAVLWQTQLQGQSGSDRWPVVLDNLVVFRTQPLRHFHDLLHDGDDVLDAAGARLADWAADWAQVRPRITQHLDANPADQTFFALDTQTGQSRGTAPVLYTFGDNDAPSPPSVYGGALYLPYRARHGIQTDSPIGVHVTTRYDADLGSMDPSSLDIAGLRSSEPFAYQFRATSDEAAVTTIAGSLLLVDSWERLGGIDLSTGRITGLAQAASESSCWSSLAPNSALPPFYDSCPFRGPEVGEGNSRAGAVAASGRIFWHVQASGLAAIGRADGSSTVRLGGGAADSTQSALPGSTELSVDALSTYVWDEQSLPASVPSDLKARLEGEISQILSAGGHLMPFYLVRGFHGTGSYPPDVTNDGEPTRVGDSNAFWYDPGELVYSLATAYPFLSPDLQGQLKSYLQAEMNRFAPLRDLPWPTDSWLKQGIGRESYQVPQRASLGTWPPPATPIQTIYALWAYARYTGDWEYVASRWSQVQALFNARKDHIDSYAGISGAIGYARIAKQLGHSAEATAGESAAVMAMQKGYNLQSWVDIANRLYPPDPMRPDEAPGRRAPVFFGMTPEVGRYLHDTNLGSVQQILNDVSGYPNGSYLWYATRLGIQDESGESSYHSPEIGWSVFLTQAYVNQASQQQLRYWLDRPWGLGDPWYIQKLVATIQAP